MCALDTTQLVEFYAQTRVCVSQCVCARVCVCVVLCMFTFQCSVNDERPRNELAAILPNSVPAIASCQLLLLLLSLLCATDAHCRNSDVMRTRRRHSQPAFLPASSLSLNVCVCVCGRSGRAWTHFRCSCFWPPKRERERDIREDDLQFERSHGILMGLAN